MDKCLKVIELFKELTDLIYSLSELELQTLLAGLQLAQLEDTKEKIKKLKQEEK